MKRIAFPVLLVCVALSLTSCASTQSKLDYAVKQMRPTLPKVVDEETTCVSIEAGSNSLIYGMTLKTIKAGQFTPEKFTSLIKPAALKNYRELPAMKQLRDAGVTLVYKYKDSTGADVAEFSVATSEL
ncbi:MAG: hypothetical protein ABL949_08030 [Fimbriimonadaceae bacterium]